VRDDRDLVLDMIEMCDLIMEHAADPGRLEGDPVVQAAAQRWIEVLGEAASKVSGDVTSAHSEIPWRDIVGTRVILAHAYFHIDPAVVGQVVSADVPKLRRQLEAVVADLADG
jgi:uncharacterized protein with HEPN domain